MHGLSIGGEVVQAAGADKAKVVVCGPQVIHHHSLILTLFATPGQKVRLPHHSRASVERMPLRPMIFGDSMGEMIQKK